jgi:predicted GH43/DUF377 family glycosyl hydrolase
MFKWKKLGKVFDPTEIKGRNWINEYSQAPSALVFDKFVRVYFSSRPNPDEKGQYVSYTGFVDLNRFNLLEILNVSENPILELGELGTFDEFGIYPASAIKNDDKVNVYYTGHTRCESVPFNTAIGLAISSDNGKTFSKMGSGPVLSYTPDEPFSLSGPKIRKFNDTWYLWYIAGRKWIVPDGKPELIYRIRMASSADGINWIKLDKNIIEDKLGANEVQASPDVLFKNEKFHMFFCYMVTPDFRKNKEKAYRIGYAYSTDLINWIRDDSKAGIDISEQGWDSEMIAYPHVFDLDGKTYMFYLGNQVGKYGFGLARLEGVLS